MSFVSLSVTLSDVSVHETWLDLYKLPRESWLKDLDSVYSAMKERISAAAAAAVSLTTLPSARVLQ